MLELESVVCGLLIGAARLLIDSLSMEVKCG